MAYSSTFSALVSNNSTLFLLRDTNKSLLCDKKLFMLYGQIVRLHLHRPLPHRQQTQP